MKFCEGNETSKGDTEKYKKMNQNTCLTLNINIVKNYLNARTTFGNDPIKLFASNCL